MISVKNIPPAVILAALYNQAGIGPYGYLTTVMTVEEAEVYIINDVLELSKHVLVTEFRWDWVMGRSIKITIDNDGNLFGEDLYDRDSPSGRGTCASIIKYLRSPKNYYCYHDFFNISN